MPATKNYVQDDSGFLNRKADANGWIKAGTSSTDSRKGVFERLRSSQGGNNYNSNLTGVDMSNLEARNELLDIDSLLQFPGDLGTNPRFNYFMLFNIYKGTSDRLDVSIRDKLGANAVFNRVAGNNRGVFGRLAALKRAAGFSGSALAIDNLFFGEISIAELAEAGNAETATRNRIAAILEAKDERPPTSAAFMENAINMYMENAQTAAETAAIRQVYTGLYASNATEIAEYNKLKGTGQSYPQEYTSPIFQNVNTSPEILDAVIDSIKASGNLILSDPALSQALDPNNPETKAVNDAKGRLLEAWQREMAKISNTFLDRDYPNPANPNQVDSRKRKTNKDNYGILSSQRRFTQAKVRSKDTIALYMPQNVSHSDGVGYSSEQLYAANLILAAAQGQQGALSGIFNRFTRGFLDQLGKFTNKFIGTDLNADALIAAKERAVPNPRRELMMTEPNARTFTYTFPMYPKNAKESEVIADIIQMFRYHEYPKLEPSGGHFLMFPSEFEIEYYMLQEATDSDRKGGLQAVRNGFMPKIGRCALRDVAVNYTPNDIWQAVGSNGAPNGVIMTLTFEEMQPLNQEHIIEGY